MKKGKSYKVKIPGGGVKTLPLVDVIRAEQKPTPLQLKLYYNVTPAEKRVFRNYSKPIRKTDRYVFEVPPSLRSRIYFKGVKKFMVIINPELRK